MKKVVVIDGECVLCSRLASLLRRIDRKRCLQVVASQSSSGSKILSLHGLTDVGAVIFLDNGKVYSASDAVIRMLAALKGPWALFRVFLLLPRSFRDRLYFWIARNRYRWFGRNHHCEVGMGERQSHQ